MNKEKETEYVMLLSEAIDTLRSYGAEDDVKWLETELEKLIDKK
jgi:transcription termination factor NusB